MPSTLCPGKPSCMDECAIHFPELLPWASWCYGSHALLWHPLGHLSSQSGVQQADPLGPFFYSLVLRKITLAIDADDDCLALLFNAWFLYDGVLAGTKSAILCALSLIDTPGQPLGLHINLPKCELFSKNDIAMFPLGMKVSHVPHLVIPIGDYFFCTSYIASKCTEATKQLSRLVEVACFDPQVALNPLENVWRLL